MSYKGKYRPTNRKKYRGDTNNITYRSLWERKFMVYLDTNKDIVEWGSDEIMIPYVSPRDKTRHRYYPEFYLITSFGDKFIVEIKPKRQTKPPRAKARKTQRYVKEVFAYGMNRSKWTYAEEYAKDRGWGFEIWTEDTLKSKGIKIIRPLKHK